MLQTCLLPRYAVEGIAPNLVVLLVAAWAILYGSREGALVALLSGFLLDLLSGAPFGLLTLSLLGAGLVCGLEEIRQVQSALLFPVVVLGASLVHDGLYLLLLRLSGWPISLMDGLLLVLLPTSLANSLLALLFAPLVHRWRVAVQVEEATP